MIRIVLLLFVSTAAFAQQPYDSVARAITAEALGSNQSIGLLKELAVGIGHRLSGSSANDRAVAWAQTTMQRLGFDNVRLERVMVPRWVRGPIEEATVRYGPGGKRTKRLHVCALGGSVGTPQAGITAEVVEVQTFAELAALGSRAKGKMVLLNRPMERTFLNTFEAYSRAVNQRGRGALEAAHAGGVAALVRSMTTGLNDIPHTGAMRYVDTIPKIPSVALSTNDAEFLSSLLRHGDGHPVIVTIRLSCQSFPDVPSANVLGEIRGNERPDDVIVIGGHLDSWDKGQGAHDDGAGCVQSIEALRILKQLGYRPKRTIRAVLFANEENGLRGGRAYADTVRIGERHIAAVESDEGGFAPRGFGVSDSSAYRVIKSWQPFFREMNADRIVLGGGGADIGPLRSKGVPLIGLNVEVQRYFDYHHADSDTFDSVNERELALGAACLAMLTYLLAQEGL